MNFFIGFVIFIIVLFVYMHVMQQYKRSEKLQLYEMDYTDNRELQTACNVKQPIVFEFRNVLSEFFYRQSPKVYLEQMGQIDVCLKDTDDYWTESPRNSVDYVVISYKSLNSLILSDARGHYISECNGDFVSDANMGDLYQRMDEYIKPAYACHTHYDILFGSPKTVFPMRYHTHDRIFLCVLSGKISVKMTNWKSYIHFKKGIVRDYENYEFWTCENPWKSSAGDTIQYLDFMVLTGQILYVPAYWFYSIRIEDPDTIISQIKYNTPANILANVSDIGKWYLQQKNIEHVGSTVPKAAPLSIDSAVIIQNDSAAAFAEISEPTIQDSLDIITKK